MENLEKIKDIEDIIILLYERGHTLKSIVNTVYRYSSGNIPLNFSFRNFCIDSNRRYTKQDCIAYVSRVILNYNYSKRK